MDRNNENLKNENKDLGPDQETLHTTDPEKNMEGPVSSSTRKTGEAFDSDETQEEADRKRDSKM